MSTPFTPMPGSASISTTEFSLPSNSTTRVPQTTACRLTGDIDLSNMAAGDQYRIRIYDKVNGSAQLVLFEAWPPAGTGAYVLPPRDVNEGWDVTLLLVTGSARTIGWSLKLGVGDVNALTLGAGAVTASSIAAAAITAAKFATDAVDSNALAATAVTEIQAGLATGSTLSALAAILASIQVDTDDIQGRLPAALDTDGNIKAGVQTLASAALTAIAGALLDTVLDSSAATAARTVRQRLKIGLGVLINRATGLAITTAGTEHIRDGGDTRDIAVYTLNTDGTRTPTVLDGD
jgi:hypothetical protein